MCMLTHVILSVPIKDRTIVGHFWQDWTYASHLAGRITRSDYEAESLNLGWAPFYKSVHSGW